MSTKVFNTRLQLKYDSWKNWYDNNPTLLAGEIAIVNVPAQTDESTGEVTQKPAILFKVGDGTTDFRTLDWASGLAADVYEWAKREKGLATEIFTADDVSVEDVLSALKETLDNLEASEVAYTKKAKNEAGEIVSGEEINVEVALDSLYEAISTLSGDSSESIADLITKVNKNSENITKAQADATQALADAAAANENANSRVSTSDFETFKSTNSQAISNAAQAAADANANAETRVKTTDFEAFKTTNTQAIDAAASAGTTAAAGVQDNLDAYVEANDAALAGVKATADAAAVKADVDSAFEAVNDDIKALEEASATHATKTELTDGLATKADKEAFEAVQTTVNNFFSDEAVVNDTIDTLKEIANYIATDKEGAADITARVGVLEGKVDVEKVSTAIATTKGEATKYTDDEIAAEVIARDAAIAAAEGRAATDAKNKADAAQTAAEATASADATTKANAAQAAAEAYTDEKVGALHEVATSGKIEDLEQEVEYVIFNCGSASTLVNDPITE